MLEFLISIYVNLRLLFDSIVVSPLSSCALYTGYLILNSIFNIYGILYIYFEEIVCAQLA